MDLILSIILVISISTFKLATVKEVDSVTSEIVTEMGETVITEVKEDTLEIGTNLYLRKEPRAYHKILDELGLS